MFRYPTKSEFETANYLLCFQRVVHCKTRCEPKSILKCLNSDWFSCFVAKGMSCFNSSLCVGCVNTVTKQL